MGESREGGVEVIKIVIDFKNHPEKLWKSIQMEQQINTFKSSYSSAKKDTDRAFTGPKGPKPRIGR